MRGTIKFFNTSRGFGFITPDDGEKDIFVHFRDIKACRTEEGIGHDFPREGDRVEFETDNNDPRGLSAKKVVIVVPEEKEDKSESDDKTKSKD